MEVKAEVTSAEDGSPEALQSLQVSISTEAGWPIKIHCDLEEKTWTEIRDEETWQTGSLPAATSEIATLLDRVESETGREHRVGWRPTSPIS